MIPKPHIQRILLAGWLTGLVGLVFYYLINSRTFQFYGGIIHRVETDRKVVALTFDDGPTQFTDELIKILEGQQVKATFFLIGQAIEQHPQYTRRLAEAGHELGNHTFSHHRMVFKPYTFMAEEVEKTDNLIRQVTHQNEILFRPPYCKKLIGLPKYLHQHHRLTITWDVEPDSRADLRKSAARLAAYTIEHTRPGSIILLHSMNPTEWQSRKALKGLITGLKGKGYSFVTVSQLLKYSR